MNDKFEKLLASFSERYAKEYDYYERSSALARQKLEALVQEYGIRAIVSHRAKDPSRLISKIRQRSVERNYKAVGQIYSDIVDLAGVRIALYFPDQRNKVKEIIENNFDVIGSKKEFPEDVKGKYKNKKFSGYWATHYRVKLGDLPNTADALRYEDAQIEIQIASVLMHAWSEVEHDLVYKPLDGDLSETEHQLLDQINGLVLAGETALEQLQVARQRRVAEQDKKFRDHFELADFLSGAMPSDDAAVGDSSLLGSSERLFNLLATVDKNTPRQVKDLLDIVGVDIENKLGIADKIYEKVYSENKERIKDEGRNINWSSIIFKNPRNSLINQKYLSDLKNLQSMYRNEPSSAEKEAFLNAQKLLTATVESIAYDKGIKSLEWTADGLKKAGIKPSDLVKKILEIKSMDIEKLSRDSTITSFRLNLLRASAVSVLKRLVPGSD